MDGWMEEALFFYKMWGSPNKVIKWAYEKSMAPTEAGLVTKQTVTSLGNTEDHSNETITSLGNTKEHWNETITSIGNTEEHSNETIHHKPRNVEGVFEWDYNKPQKHKKSIEMKQECETCHDQIHALRPEPRNPDSGPTLLGWERSRGTKSSVLQNLGRGVVLCAPRNVVIVEMNINGAIDDKLTLFEWAPCLRLNGLKGDQCLCGAKSVVIEHVVQTIASLRYWYKKNKNIKLQKSFQMKR